MCSVDNKSEQVILKHMYFRVGRNITIKTIIPNFELKFGENLVIETC